MIKPGMINQSLNLCQEKKPTYFSQRKVYLLHFSFYTGHDFGLPEYTLVIFHTQLIYIVG